MRLRLLLLLLAASSVACGGGSSGSGAEDTTGPGADTLIPGYDTLPGQDGVGPLDDTTGPGADTPRLPPDVPPGIDADPGSLELGEECSADGQCVSGLCFRVAGMSGCTLTCDVTADCQAFGLLCVALREGVRACVPQPVSADASCGSHGACAYPLVCREDTGWCALPECTWSGDCGAGEECEPATRRCQPTVCVSTYECEHPLQVCAGGACGAPACTATDQCPVGHFCHPTQLQCQEAEPCNAEGGCDVYNQACVDGMCVPDLCLAPCTQVGEQCNPATGKCGKPCGDPGDCPAGEACAQAAGLCYSNGAPLALLDGVAGLGVDAAVGQALSLDGDASVDPEGEALTWEWVVNAAPPGSQPGVGAALDCSSTPCQFFPDLAGQYLLGLRVTDPAGAVSTQAQVGVWAQ
ncbi:MAG: hypothetical protein ABIK09_12015 [Pseudomonadota bacterium]